MKEYYSIRSKKVLVQKFASRMHTSLQESLRRNKKNFRGFATLCLYLSWKVVQVVTYRVCQKVRYLVYRVAKKVWDIVLDLVLDQIRTVLGPFLDHIEFLDQIDFFESDGSFGSYWIIWIKLNFGFGLNFGIKLNFRIKLNFWIKLNIWI